jgi:hypothetical protein
LHVDALRVSRPASERAANRNRDVSPHRVSLLIREGRAEGARKANRNPKRNRRRCRQQQKLREDLGSWKDDVAHNQSITPVCENGRTGVISPEGG